MSHDEEMMDQNLRIERLHEHRNTYFVLSGFMLQFIEPIEPTVSGIGCASRSGSL
jgi:hypothetical protein